MFVWPYEANNFWLSVWLVVIGAYIFAKIKAKITQESKKLIAAPELSPWGSIKIRNWKAGAKDRELRNCKTYCSEHISLKKFLKDSSIVIILDLE